MTEVIYSDPEGTVSIENALIRVRESEKEIKRIIYGIGRGLCGEHREDLEREALSVYPLIVEEQIPTVRIPLVYTFANYFDRDRVEKEGSARRLGAKLEKVLVGTLVDEEFIDTPSRESSVFTPETSDLYWLFVHQLGKDIDEVNKLPEYSLRSDIYFFLVKKGDRKLKLEALKRLKEVPSSYEPGYSSMTRGDSLEERSVNIFLDNDMPEEVRDEALDILVNSLRDVTEILRSRLNKKVPDRYRGDDLNLAYETAVKRRIGNEDSLDHLRNLFDDMKLFLSCEWGRDTWERRYVENQVLETINGAIESRNISILMGLQDSIFKTPLTTYLKYCNEEIKGKLLSATDLMPSSSARLKYLKGVCEVVVPNSEDVHEAIGEAKRDIETQKKLYEERTGQTTGLIMKSYN